MLCTGTRQQSAPVLDQSCRSSRTVATQCRTFPAPKFAQHPCASAPPAPLRYPMNLAFLADCRFCCASVLRRDPASLRRACLYRSADLARHATRPKIAIAQTHRRVQTSNAGEANTLAPKARQSSLPSGASPTTATTLRWTFLGGSLLAQACSQGRIVTTPLNFWHSLLRDFVQSGSASNTKSLSVLAASEPRAGQNAHASACHARCGPDLTPAKARLHKSTLCEKTFP